jgi:hypothetical protein
LLPSAAAILSQFFVYILYDMMPESQSKDKPLLQDSKYNIIHQLEKKSLIFSIQRLKSIPDAEKDNKPELVKLWNTIKEDEQNHLRMLREELIKR